MKRWLWAMVSLVLCGGMVGCRAVATSFSRSGCALDTAVAVTIYDNISQEKAEEALTACFNEIERLEALLSISRDGSDVTRLNTAAGNPVAISPETAEVLWQAKRYAELSDGAFDLTVRPITALWDFKAENPAVPAKEMLSQAAKAVDYRQLMLTNTTAQLSANGAVDLGGIAKGYIADAVCRVLKEKGVTSALIDLGGNIVMCGNKKGEPFRIGVKDPFDTTRLCAVITGEDSSVVTSGVYERGFTVDGVRYHHILDPKTGMPVDNGLASVTVVCRSSAMADAFSTACFVLGEEKGMALVQSQDNVEALFIRTDG
ncbi:MAG: FAD:protein FMN transferase, partial [Clostridia bacterium]|nr:FAD:protein FMN transferase [Clostridia bacterium]